MTSLVLPRFDLPPVFLLLGESLPEVVERCQRYADALQALGVRTVTRALGSADVERAAAGCRIGLFFGVADGPAARRIRNGIASLGGFSLADGDSQLADCGALVPPAELESLWRQRQPDALVPASPADKALRVALLLAAPRGDDAWQRTVIRLADGLANLGQAVTVHVALGPRWARASDAELAALLRARLGARRLAVARGWEPTAAHVILAADRHAAACASQLPGSGQRIFLHDGHPMAMALAEALGLASVILTDGDEASPAGLGDARAFRLSPAYGARAADLLAWLRRPDMAGALSKGPRGADRPRLCDAGHAACAPERAWPLAAGAMVRFVIEPRCDALVRIDLQLVPRRVASASRLILTVREYWRAPQHLAIGTVPCSQLVAGLWTAFEFPSLVGVAGSSLHVTLTLENAAPNDRVDLMLTAPEAGPAAAPEGTETGGGLPALALAGTETAGQPASVPPAYRLFALDPPGRYGTLAGVVMADWLRSEEATLWRREATWRQFLRGREWRLLRFWWWLSGRLPSAGERPWSPDAGLPERLWTALRFYGPRAALALLRREA